MPRAMLASGHLLLNVTSSERYRIDHSVRYRMRYGMGCSVSYSSRYSMNCSTSPRLPRFHDCFCYCSDSILHGFLRPFPTAGTQGLSRPLLCAPQVLGAAAPRARHAVALPPVAPHQVLLLQKHPLLLHAILLPVLRRLLRCVPRQLRASKAEGRCTHARGIVHRNCNAHVCKHRDFKTCTHFLAEPVCVCIGPTQTNIETKSGLLSPQAFAPRQINSKDIP